MISLNFFSKKSNAGWYYYARWLEQIERTTIVIVLKEYHNNFFNDS